MAAGALLICDMAKTADMMNRGNRSGARIGSSEKTLGLDHNRFGIYAAGKILRLG
jgi:hypothetical protein